MKEIIFTICLLMMTVSSFGESDDLLDAGVVAREKPAYIWDDLKSEDLVYTDFSDVSTDVCLLCLNDNGKTYYRLGFVSDEDDYQYCKIESLNGTLENNVIGKFETVRYWIEYSQSKEDMADILSIKYYDADGKVLSMQEKKVYLPESGTIVYTYN